MGARYINEVLIVETVRIEDAIISGLKSEPPKAMPVAVTLP